MESVRNHYRSYSRCMRDGMAYALKNFSTLLALSKYSLAFVVVTQLVLLWAQENMMSRIMQGQFGLVSTLLYFLALLLVVAGMCWQLSVFVSHQRQQFVQPADDEAEECKLQPNLLRLGTRIFAVSLVMGLMLSIICALFSAGIFFLYGLLSAHLHSLLLLFLTVGIVFALGFALVLYATGVLRLLYLQYVYSDASFTACVRQLRSLRRYVGRTVALEVLLCCACMLLSIAFSAPLLVMNHVHELSVMDTIKMDGTEVPSYFTALRYFAAVVSALGSVFAVMLCSYPMCYNYLSIRCREVEREQQ